MLVAAACGSDNEPAAASDTTATPAITGATTTTDAPAPTSPPSTTEATATTIPPDLAVFIAAVNEGLEDTTYEDAALDDPEVFIGVGQLFCELIAEGLTIDEVLAEYLSALENPDDGSIADEDALVSGVLMGASLEVLCPEHDEAA